MDYYGSEVLDTNANVQPFFNRKVFEVHGVNGHGGLEGLFEYL